MKHEDIDHTGITGAGSPTEITDIPTAEMDDTLVLAPDGAGGVEFRAETGGSAGVDAAHTKRTAGDLTLNSTTWANVDTGMDITLPAATGDLIEASVSALAGAQAVSIYMDVATIVAGSPVNYFASSGGGSDTPAPWVGFASATTVISGTVMYTVQAGDISGGNVVLRLRYRESSATNKIISGVAGIPLHFAAKNYG